ncbi:sugar 3,4-ketoisomerase [Kistimonas asteriae]|uniref:sugar 3,4-ketoisomerase n=1 Tax=Kistimonas asteriae TaxID=517724 RepID=UPI001BACB52B|nr:FdtA/QdtA family cupin domain-containing protein [Kistimonas asteriae]
MTPEIIVFKEIVDQRGGLVALEEHKNIPFTLKRVYYIYGTPTDCRRGFHAHIALRQVAVCVKGTCTFLLDNGHGKVDVCLESPDKGLLIDKMVWHEMYDFSEDCILMVLASDIYCESDYIRDYNHFLKAVH